MSGGIPGWDAYGPTSRTAHQESEEEMEAVRAGNCLFDAALGFVAASVSVLMFGPVILLSVAFFEWLVVTFGRGI